MLLGMTTAASAASTSASHSLPKVQTSMSGGWHHSITGWKVRPGEIVFGAEYGIDHIHWASWTGRSAWGHGVLFEGPIQDPKSAPATVHVWNVHSHSGPGRYFKDLRYTGRYIGFLRINGGVWTNNTSTSVTSSSTRSVPVLYASIGNWQHPTVEPGSFPLGAFFILTRLYWTRWNSVASANGIDNWSNGAAGRPHHWASVITLYRVRDHRSHRYYTRMKITSHGHRTIHLVYRIPGGWFQS